MVVFVACIAPWSNSNATGLKGIIASPSIPMHVGERVEMGGVLDEERGALIYKKTTKVHVVPAPAGSEYQRKKVTSITSETGWLGRDSSKKTKIVSPWKEPLHDDTNPLYSEKDYGEDFMNPVFEERDEEDGVMRGRRHPPTAHIELEERPTKRQSGREERYEEYLAGDQHVDTLF